MFNSVQYVRELCQERKLPISQLEKDCGFSNGYLNPKKISKIPYDRAVVIAKYLNISVDTILTGEEKTPTAIGERKDIRFALANTEEALTPQERELIRKFRRLDARGQASVLMLLDHEFHSVPGEQARSVAENA